MTPCKEALSWKALVTTFGFSCRIGPVAWNRLNLRVLP